MLSPSEFDKVLKICYTYRDVIEKYLICEYNIFPTESSVKTPTLIGCMYSSAHPKIGIISLDIRESNFDGLMLSCAVSGVGCGVREYAETPDELFLDEALKYTIEQIRERLDD